MSQFSCENEFSFPLQVVEETDFSDTLGRTTAHNCEHQKQLCDCKEKHLFKNSLKCRLQGQIVSEVRAYKVQILIHVQMVNENITVCVSNSIFSILVDINIRC